MALARDHYGAVHQQGLLAAFDHLEDFTGRWRVAARLVMVLLSADGRSADDACRAGVHASGGARPPRYGWIRGRMPTVPPVDQLAAITSVPAASSVISKLRAVPSARFKL